MKKVNGFTVYEGTDKCALDEYSEQLAQELKEEFEKNKYDDSEVKQDIQDLQSEQETQNTAILNNTEELELLKNNLPDEVSTEQSEEITVQDAMNYYGSLDVSGNSTQDTRSGKNKLYLADVAETTNGNGITYSVKDGVITLNGTSIRAHYINFNSSKFDLPAGDYTMSGKELAGSCSGSSGKQLNNEDNSKNLFNGGTMTSTVSNTLENDETGVHLALYIGSTAVFNNYKFEIQLEEGTTATEYEKYGAMPSPDYPSKIKNCKTSINIKVENANKYVPFEASWGAFRGIELAFYLDGTVKLNGTAAASGGRDVTKNVSTKNLLKAGKSYTMYSEIVSGTGQTGHVYLNRVSDNSGLRFCQDGSVRNFTQNEDVEVYWGINVNEGNVFNNLVLRLGLFEGTYTYEEIKKRFDVHKEQTLTFPLVEGQRLHLKDCLADDGIHHKKQTITFNGTEDWALNTVSSSTQIKTISFAYYAPNLKPSDTEEDICLCNLLKAGLTSQLYAVDKESLWINANYIYIRINRDRLETEDVAGLKKYLSKHNMTVEYPVVTEIIESYTQEQQTVHNELQKLLLYKGYNYIACIDETKCKMKLTYRPDTNYKELQRMNCLGDSITQGLTNNNVSFADYLELSVIKYGVSGTTIAKQEGETNSFLERYSSMGQADITMVMGGTNDCNLDIPLGESTSTNEYEFYGALKSLCSGLITKYADKLIFFATPIKRKTTQTNLQQYAQAIKDVCATYNIPVLDLYNDLNMNPNVEAQYTKYYNDWLHPNNEGHKRIARKVQKYIDNEL